MASHPAGEPSRLHWRALLRRTLLLLGVWLLVGPVLGIVFIEEVNRLTIGGLPLGFWVAQQGAIYVFVVLIFLNAVLADRAEPEA